MSRYQDRNGRVTSDQRVRSLRHSPRGEEDQLLGGGVGGPPKKRRGTRADAAGAAEVKPAETVSRIPAWSTAGVTPVQQMVGEQPSACVQPAPEWAAPVITATADAAGALVQSCPAALTDTGNCETARLSAKQPASVLFIMESKLALL